MKIAIFHDFIDTIGGGEKLILTLARELKADVITTDLNPESVKRMELEDVNIISLGNTIKMAPFKQISASIKFAKSNFLTEYDFFIFSGNWAPFAAKRHKPNLFYCHTPVRVFYDLYDVFLQSQSIFTKPFYIFWVKFHKLAWEYYLQYVEIIVVNSKNTKSRLEKFLGRSAEVVHPAIDISKYHFKENGDFWLSINRLYPEKRVELQIESFKLMPEEKLIIVGDFAYGDHSLTYTKKIKENIPNNIELRPSVTETELIELFARCKGFITTAMDEDFGMTPIEAMASGKPVICVKEGGYLETMIDGVTGIMVKANTQEIVNAVKIISENPGKYRTECRNRAKDFNISVFLSRITRLIQQHSNT